VRSGSASLKVFLRRDYGTVSGRKVINQDNLEALLCRCGFVAVDPGRMKPLEQIDIASRAKVLVGSMGAALANMVWADPGTKVIAIAGFLPGANYGLFPTLASVLGHDFHFVIGEMRGAHRTSELNRDIWIDLDAVARALEA
jgi:capsular polysaccharide biosynthesis protein